MKIQKTKAKKKIFCEEEELNYKKEGKIGALRVPNFGTREY